MHPDDRVPDEPFTWPEARARGLTRKRLATYVREGHVRRVLRNVYVAAGVDDSLETRVAAASKVTSAWAVICDRTAAWLWGVDTFEFRELEILPPVESFVLRGHTRTRRLGVAGGVRDLASRDLVEIGGVTVTSPLRTALDLACTLGRRDALAALDGFMRLHGITREQMHRELRRYRG
ncbi:MAG: type IV toxin-antitoxin system AbiEi family antitoxin domain-containing protein, partial [Nocardioidaceae bacterium]|nr:type IV toxin-antitoxin system AbiEi family antitoxin domain-containing protein [Nocardioidaceae bacterium]